MVIGLHRFIIWQMVGWSPITLDLCAAKKSGLEVCIDNLHSLKLTVRTWKWMVGRRSFPFGMAHFQVLCSFQGVICTFSWATSHFSTDEILIFIHFSGEILPPKKWRMTMDNPRWMKMYFLLKMGMFQCHVSFPGCISLRFFWWFDTVLWVYSSSFMEVIFWFQPSKDFSEQPKKSASGVFF